MARLRNDNAAALIPDRTRELAEIADWYRRALADEPARRWNTGPTLIGPTWKRGADGGWLLPEHTLGWDFLAWCGYWLRDSKARTPWKWTLEQARFWLWFYALDDEGRPLHDNAVLQRLKGWGKDPMAAGGAVASCFAPLTFDHWDPRTGEPVGREEPNAWVQVCAVSQEQTKNTMKLLPGLIPMETRRHYGIQLGKLNMYALGDSRQIEAVTSSPLALEGGRPTFLIRNETQNWNSSNGGHDMDGVLSGNAAKSADGVNAKMLDICNAYRDGEAIVMFLDCSLTDDATALVACRVADGFVKPLGLWQRPPGKRGDTWKVPREGVDDTVREAMRRWHVVAFWGDPSHVLDDETGLHYWDPLFDAWHRDYGRRLRLWARPEGRDRHAVMFDMARLDVQKRFVAYVDQAYTAIADKDFPHDGDARLRRHMLNARRQPTRAGMSIAKEGRESKRKIDLAFCAIAARGMRREYLNARKQGGGQIW